MKKTKYKGIKGSGKVPNTKTDLSDSDDINDMEPDYVKKHLRHKRHMTVTQLKLFGNPYDPNY